MSSDIKQRKLETNRRWRKRQKQLFQEYKNKLKCEICGEDEMICLDFHHLNPKEKEGDISHLLLKQNRSFKRVLEEVEKCVVLCSNCHRKVHAGLIELPHKL